MTIESLPGENGSKEEGVLSLAKIEALYNTPAELPEGFFEEFGEGEILKRVWKEVLFNQDKRGDVGHAATVLRYAAMLLGKGEELELDPVVAELFGEERRSLDQINPSVVMLAATFHDIGYATMSEEERRKVVDGTITKKRKEEIRYQHQLIGAMIAANTLVQMGYNPELSVEIVDIVLHHDTRRGTISWNDALMRDADKLWRFSRRGMELDVVRANNLERQSFAYWLERREREIDEEGYFFTEAARKIARGELEQRRKEFEGR